MPDHIQYQLKRGHSSAFRFITAFGGAVATVTHDLVMLDARKPISPYHPSATFSKTFFLLHRPVPSTLMHMTMWRIIRAAANTSLSFSRFVPSICPTGFLSTDQIAASESCEYCTTSRLKPSCYPTLHSQARLRSIFFMVSFIRLQVHRIIHFPNPCILRFNSAMAAIKTHNCLEILVGFSHAYYNNN